MCSITHKTLYCAAGVGLINSCYDSIHLLNKIDPLILKIIEGVGFGIDDRLNVEIGEDFETFIRKAGTESFYHLIVKDGQNGIRFRSHGKTYL